jgi:hypothetical protein
MESSKYQATVGKLALGLIVTDMNGGKLDFVKALIRNVSKIVSTITLSRPDLGLHELTCKQDDKIRKNSSGTRGYHCRVFAGRYDLS